MKILCLALGGVMGTLARYGLTAFVTHRAGMGFSFGTLAVNLTGCFTIGLIGAIGEGRWPLPYEARLFAVTGFCGAFTTFSALILESSDLGRQNVFLAALYIAASVAGGLLLFRAGLMLGRFF